MDLRKSFQCKSYFWVDKCIWKGWWCVPYSQFVWSVGFESFQHKEVALIKSGDLYIPVTLADYYTFVHICWNMLCSISTSIHYLPIKIFKTLGKLKNNYMWHHFCPMSSHFWPLIPDFRWYWLNSYIDELAFLPVSLASLTHWMTLGKSPNLPAPACSVDMLHIKWWGGKLIPILNGTLHHFICVNLHESLWVYETWN